MGYTVKTDSEKTARAQGKEITISPKHAVEICRTIRGMDLNAAKDLLNDVAELKKAIPFRRYNKLVPHQKGIGPGRFPEKACREILKVIESAQTNAENKDNIVDSDNMKIVVASASRGRVFPGRIPRAHGRATPSDQETVNVEIILEEMEE